MYLVWGERGDIQRFWGVFAVQATFVPAGAHEHNQRCRTGIFGCLATSHQISQYIDWEILFV